MHPDSEKAAEVVRAHAGDAPVDVGLVLGSGLAAIADHIATPSVIAYDHLPGFSHPTTGGHEAELVVGTLGTARLAVLKGRTHYYETGDVAAMRVPLETLALIGAKAVVVTNSAGSTRQDIVPGSLIAIRNHINLTGLNPLIGLQDDSRFVDMSAPYDHVLRERFHVAASEAGRRTGEGVYMWFTGPSFETAAEVEAARKLGADLVGMSTVPEVIIARQLGLRVLAISMVTNYAAGLSPERIAHERTMRVAGAATHSLTRVLVKFCEIWVLDSNRR
jgi:purine-nucleoside phosphorylase